jgi:ATP-dependent helicase YprA (DUF1998 family)/predicted Zn-ribbon and HTH transcriptional regulator
MHDPIGAFQRIRELFISYLDTATRIEPSELAEERRALLRQPGTLCTDPLLEPQPTWSPDGRSFEELSRDTGDDAVLAPLTAAAREALLALIGSGLIGRDRQGQLLPPYSHQVAMLRRGLRDGQAGIVTSGTGSGKTEAFLLPVLATILEEATRADAPWTAPEPGFLQRRWWRGSDDRPIAVAKEKGLYEVPKEVRINGLSWDGYQGNEQRRGETRPAAIRALILYPMNALVEDQMTRLRQALDSQEARDCLDSHLAGNRIFFGRYTGRTKGGPCYQRPHEIALSKLRRGEGSATIADRVIGSGMPTTLNKWKASVSGSRQRRIEDLLCELSSLDDLEAAIRTEAKLPAHRQVSCQAADDLREKAFAFPSLDGAEMLTRWDMQDWPPDILVTNISMLNAMLSRGTEARMLEITRDWLASDPRNRFTLVIDELHLQRGSEGTEFIYLLRLLLVRLGLDAPERHHQLRLLASSASLPVGEDAREASLDYLRDAFADFGLHHGASRNDWLAAIVPGDVEPIRRDATTPALPLDPRQVEAAVADLLASAWAPQDPDELLPPPDFERHGEPLNRFLDALAVPAAADPLERWHHLAAAASLALEGACHDPGHPQAVATKLPTLARRLWPDHGWDGATTERILRVLSGVVGAVDRPGAIGEQLRHLRRQSAQPLPRFRVHTFFKSLDGVFAEVVPPARRDPALNARWQGSLSLERLGTRAALQDGAPMARQFELLHCECCGENFLGGIRAGGAPLDESYVEEILPNEADTEKLPDLPVADRFEEFTYRTYAIVWPCDDNSATVDDPDNDESWRRIWLDPSSGLLLAHNRHPGELQPGYLFTRPAQEKYGFSALSPGSHMPCRCPRCTSDYARRRPFKRSLLQISPIGPQRSGFGRATQLLASEIYDVLAREGEANKARLVSFSDSRQGAAKTSLDVENLHHRDILREVLLVCLLQACRSSAAATAGQRAELEEIETEIAAKRAKGVADTSPLLKPLIDYRSQLLGPLQLERLGVIPLGAILDLERPQPGEPVKPFIATLVELGIHPFDERGLARVWLGKTLPAIDWWRLFDRNAEGTLIWSIPTEVGLTESAYKDVVQEFVTGPVLRALGDVVFRKTCFALEATGFAYPVPLPPMEDLASLELEEEELCRAAAWMRIYTDDYRLDPTPWQAKTTAIEEQKLDKGRSSLACLMQSLAHSLGGSAEAQGSAARKIMGRLKHSSPSDDYVRLNRIGFRIPADDAPFWRCSNCRRVHLHRGLGACTRCGTALPQEATGVRGALLRENVLGRKLRRSIDGETGHSDIFRLRCEELTGQTVDPATRQREFKGIRLAREMRHPLQPHGIEMLAVTTTMEVGIDIGPLEAVLQANMPPQRFNYQQRVGRAGRREQAFSFVLTLCRNRSHDHYYFRHPELITGETPPPPFLVKGLARIADRLVRKDRLVRAFRWLEERHRTSSGGFWAGDLVKPVDVHGDFIPANTLADPALGPTWVGWLREALKATEADTRRTMAALDRQRPHGQPDTDPLELEEIEVLLARIGEGIGMVGANTAGLAAHLANYGELPMYGLPTRVRDLVFGKSYGIEAKSLSRDLELAIYEYAPGNVLIHDKYEHRCIGLTPRIARAGKRLETLQSRPWDRRFLLGRCPSCGAWQQLEQAIETAHRCPSCQVESDAAAWICRHCIEPAGFRTDFDPQRKPTYRLQGSASNSLCADANPPAIEAWRVHKLVRDGASLALQLTSNASTTVYRLNRGPEGQGFDLRWKEGFIGRPNADRLRPLVVPEDDNLPLKAQAIDGRLLKGDAIQTVLVDPLLKPTPAEEISGVYLTAPRVTDGLYLLPVGLHPQLALPLLGGGTAVPLMEPDPAGGATPLQGEQYWQGVRSAAISATELLIARATKVLDVDHRALQAVEPRPFLSNGESLPLIQIVDEHVNGAGFSAWLGGLGERTPPILEVLAWILGEQVESLASGVHGSTCQEACYRCLKNYENQNLHGLLDWQLGLAYLRAFTDPQWACGLDGDFSWGPMRGWPQLAERTAEITLNLWGADRSAIRTHQPRGGPELLAFQLPQAVISHSPWVIVRHPLWRWGLEQGPLVDFSRHLQANEGAGEVLCWDTFNLTRRPGRTRQWIASQAPPRRGRSRGSRGGAKA